MSLILPSPPPHLFIFYRPTQCSVSVSFSLFLHWHHCAFKVSTLNLLCLTGSGFRVMIPSADQICECTAAVLDII